MNTSVVLCRTGIVLQVIYNALLIRKDDESTIATEEGHILKIMSNTGTVYTNSKV